MKKALNIFFVALGVIFFILLLIKGAYFLMGTPTSSQPTFIQNVGTNPATTNTNSTADANPMLSAEQEAALRTFGIDPATVPSTITPEAEACFVAAIGAERVAQIKAGDSPSATEFFKAKGCI